MKLSQKHTDVKPVSFTDFSGGVNISKSPEAINDNEVQSAENFEFNYMNGALSTAPGFVEVFNASGDILSLFYLPFNNTFVYTVASAIWVTDLSTKTYIGDLTGVQLPDYEIFNSKVLIASGGNLQSWDGSTLSTIVIAGISTGTILPYIVKEDDSRLLVVDYNDDYFYWSGIGDETNWTFDTNDANAKFLEVGYQDGCQIRAVTKLSQDIIVYKNNSKNTKPKIMRVAGKYPNWQVLNVAESECSVNRFTSVSAGNDAFFFGVSGFKALSTVTEYGSIKSYDAGKNVNSFLSKNFSFNDARMWHVPSKNQIWIKLQNDRYVYMYHYAGSAFTSRRFVTGNVTSLVNVDDEVYIVIGQKILKMDENVFSEDGATYTGVLKLKRLTAQNNLLILRAFISAETLGVGSAVLTIGRYPIQLNLSGVGVPIYGDIGDIYGDTGAIWEDSSVQSSLWMNHRVKSIDITLQVNSGGVALRSIDLQVAEV